MILSRLWAFATSLFFCASSFFLQTLCAHHLEKKEMHRGKMRQEALYIAMALVYAEHPEMRKQLDPFHPQLADFMAKAMRIFAENKLV